MAVAARLELLIAILLVATAVLPLTRGMNLEV